MQDDPRYGVFHNYARDDFELPCRRCGKIVTEDAIKCSQCGTLAPGIYSECPSCYSKNYLWKHYGVHYSGALGGLITMGPLGALFFGLKGRTAAECVCLNCGQGWMPFAFPGGKWTTTRKFKLNNAADKNTGKKMPSMSAVSEAEKERIRQEQIRRRQELQREQERIRIAKEREKAHARARRRVLFAFIIALVCVVKFISIKVNENKDSWKIAYDNWMTPDGYYEKQVFYALSDMNMDGVPELISIEYDEEGRSQFEICTYREQGECISILYSENNVFPYKIGKGVKVFYNSEGDSTTTYSCRMRGRDLDYSAREKGSKPEPVGLIPYEEGDILSGRYKEKEAVLSYMTPPLSSEVECWDFDINTAYQIVSEKYTLEEVYETLKVKVYETDSYAGKDDMRFDAELFGCVGEMKYLRRQKEEEQHWTCLAWDTFECIDESTIMQEFGLTKVGMEDKWFVYDWEGKVIVKVKYYMNATDIYFYAYR